VGLCFGERAVVRRAAFAALYLLLFFGAYLATVIFVTFHCRFSSVAAASRSRVAAQPTHTIGGEKRDDKCSRNEQA